MSLKLLVMCLMIIQLDSVYSITQRHSDYTTADAILHHQTVRNDDDKYYKIAQYPSHFQPTFEFTKERDKYDIAATATPKIECPAGETGIFAYAMDCRQFLNCWKGIGTIQSCAPGTLFNSLTNECDHPAKVKCYMYGELTAEEPPRQTSDRYIQNNRIDLFAAQQNPVVASAASICRTYVYGLYAHPTDCAKYINCANGAEYIQDCGPGTVFNPLLKICDWPHNVDCSSYYVATGANERPATVDTPYYGEGNLDMRMSVDNDYVGIRTDKALPIYPIYERPNGYRKESTFNHNRDYGNTISFATTSTTTPKPEVISFSRDVNVLANRQSTQRYPFGTNSQLQDQILLSSNPKQSVAVFNATRLDIYLQPPKYSPKPTHQALPPSYSGGIDVFKGVDDSFLAYETTPSTPTTAKSDERLDESLKVLRSYSQQASGKALDVGSSLVKSVTTKIAPATTKPPDFHVPVDTNLQESIRMLTSYSKVRRYPNVDATDTVDSVASATQLGMMPLSEALKALFRPYSGKKQADEQSHDHVSKMVASNLMQMVGGVDADTTTPTTTTIRYEPTSPAEDVNAKIPLPLSEYRSSKLGGYHNHHHHHHNHHNHYHHSNKDFQHSEQYHKNQWQWHQSATTAMPTTIPNTPQPPTVGTPLPLIGNLFPASIPEENADDLISNVSNKSDTERRHLVENFDSSIGSIDPRINTIDDSEHCDNGFNCENSKCLPFDKLCDGRNDCGNRLDEQNCDHIGYEIRLSNDNGTKHMGRVEIKVFGTWGYVCDDKFGMTDADVVCRELGFHHGAEEVLGNSVYMPNEHVQTRNKTIFVMDGVECKGNETSLKDCDFNGWGIHDCNAEEVVGVVCKTHGEMCPLNYVMCDKPEKCIPLSFICDGVQDCVDKTDEDESKCNATVEFRLTAGSNEYEGRVEVRYQNIWGTVCDDDFGDAEATVICRSLGFGGIATVANNSFGPGIGPIWLDQVSCLGNETNLTSCMHFDWGDHNCNHSEDISVRCSRGPVKAAYTIPPTPKRRIDIKKPQHTNVINHHDTASRYDGERFGKILQSDIENCGQVQMMDDTSVEDAPTFRVISGNYAKRGYHPWQATLRVKGRNGKSSHWCGAVLISKYHLLTAAHCLGGFVKGAYFIRLGDHNSDMVEDSEVEVFIDNWFIHEEFRKGQHMNNDIALIIVKHPIQFTDYIQPICLPAKHTPYVSGTNCTISGWGSMYYEKSTPSLDLRAATVPIIRDDICKRTDVYGTTITNKMFCAGFLENEGIDACEGDSGGPLVCLNNDVNTLYGIISWGYRCGFANKPGVYVKITEYLDWIQDKMVYSITST